MEKRDRLTRILAFGGTLLVLFPVVSPLIFSLALFARARVLHFDYLLPAEFFPLALVGSIFLVWAAWRAHLHRKLIYWGAGIAVGSLIAGQALAVITGLASGTIEPGGPAWTLVVVSLVVYTLALAAAGVGGILLLRDVNPSSRQRRNV